MWGAIPCPPAQRYPTKRFLARRVGLASPKVGGKGKPAKELIVIGMREMLEGAEEQKDSRSAA